MASSNLAAIIIMSGIFFWIPLFCHRGGYRGLLVFLTGSAPFCGALFLFMRGCSLDCCALFWGLSLLLMLFSFSLSLLIREIGKAVMPELVFACAGALLFGSLFMPFLAENSAIRPILLMWSVPMAAGNIVGVNILRDIWYDYSPLSSIFILIPSIGAYVTVLAAGSLLCLSGSGIIYIVKRKVFLKGTQA